MRGRQRGNLTVICDTYAMPEPAIGDATCRQPAPPRKRFQPVASDPSESRVHRVEGMRLHDIEGMTLAEQPQPVGRIALIVGLVEMSGCMNGTVRYRLPPGVHTRANSSMTSLG